MLYKFKEVVMLMFISALLISNPSKDVTSSNKGQNINRAINNIKNLQLNKNDAGFNYQLGLPKNAKVTNPGDEYESTDVLYGSNSIYKSIDENGIYYNVKKQNKLDIQPIDADPNEDNDNFDKASTVYKVGQDEGHYGNWVQWGATINQKTSGWWLWETKYVDKDFYSFDVTVSGKLNVKLINIPSGCGYDMRLYKHTNSKDNSLSKLNFNNYLSISQNGGNNNEEIGFTVTPGTYYIAVYSYMDNTWSEKSYLIQFEQTESNTIDSSKNYNISNGRNNDDLGAIWRSAYNPVGIKPTSLSIDNAKFRFDCYNNYPYITHLYNKYMVKIKISNMQEFTFGM